MRFFNKLQGMFETQMFGVCAYLADRLGVSVTAIRLFFIYGSFLTVGSPIAIYLGLAFLMNYRRHIRNRRRYYYEI